MNKILKGTEAYEIITDDWEDEVLLDVDDHGCSDVIRIYNVDKELIQDYPELAQYQGYWGRKLQTHPYNGEIYGDDFITPYEHKQVISYEWVEVKDD